MEVDRLLRELEHNLESAKLSLKRRHKPLEMCFAPYLANGSTESEDLLGKLKVLGRDVTIAEPIFTKKVG